jgi:NADH:ubiquinone oxidoreductase subunit 2 (subunit N)
MILGTLVAMAQNKVERLLTYSFIAHVGYLLINFSCGTIEGIQLLLIEVRFLELSLFFSIKTHFICLANKMNKKCGLKM